jgi:hypothetical protein
MSNFLKYASSLVLALALIGCQGDSSEETAQQPSQQSQTQQPGPMGQSQQSAPDIDVSDEEAGQFVDAVMEAQKVQMESQQKMKGIIEDNGLDIKTYQKIAQSTQQQGQTAQDVDVSESQMEKFKAVSKELQAAQAKIQEDAMAAVEETGMEPQRFQQINQAIQQDRQLQQKVQKIMKEKQGMQQGQQMQPSNNN